MRRVLVCAGFSLWLLTVPAAAAERAIAITIYNGDLALVQDRRDIDVAKSSEGDSGRGATSRAGAARRPEALSCSGTHHGGRPPIQASAFAGSGRDTHHHRVSRSAERGAQAKLLPLLPGVTLRTVRREQAERVQISNGRAQSIQIELSVMLNDGAEVIRADHPMSAKNGKPIFRLAVAERGSLILRYQIQYLTQSNSR